LNLSTSRTWSGLSSNDGKGFRNQVSKNQVSKNQVSDPLPARSDGPDNVDGGPDAGDIAPRAFRSKGAVGLTKRKNAALAGVFVNAALTASCKSRCPPPGMEPDLKRIPVRIRFLATWGGYQ
jgi:hypothetical protein